MAGLRQRFRFLSWDGCDARGLGVIASRKARRVDARVTMRDDIGGEPVELQWAASLRFPQVPEHHRNCDLPRCPVCHWAAKGWGSEAEAIESWRQQCLSSSPD